MANDNGSPLVALIFGMEDWEVIYREQVYKAITQFGDKVIHKGGAE